MTPRREQGMALTELMVTIALEFIAFAMILSALLSTSNVYEATSRSGTVRANGLVAVERLTNDLRWANSGSVLVTQDNGADRLDFMIPTTDLAGDITWAAVAWRWEPSAFDADRDGVADDGALVRLEGARREVVCERVIPGGLDATWDGNVVVFTLQLVSATRVGATRSIAIDGTARPRNAPE